MVIIVWSWIYNYLCNDEVYSIQHYVIKFVSDLQQVCGFLQVTPVSSTSKTDHHDITEVLFLILYTDTKMTLFPMIHADGDFFCILNYPIVYILFVL
jgi:hypothetical protein